MIFVTVGSQMAFDRLIATVDTWAAQAGRSDVFAQIGPSTTPPRHIQWTQFLTPAAFRENVAKATVVIAHAGMGSIITALELGKPILVMPRRGALKETRNDHQVDTARQFLAQGRIGVAFDEQELIGRLNTLDQLDLSRPRCSAAASPELLEALRRFVDSGDPCLTPAFRVTRTVAAPVASHATVPVVREPSATTSS
jgi:UDP-N-acetylglucosamine transferase subunit ALG13